jgi:beta-1,4-mannosyltransferase
VLSTLPGRDRGTDAWVTETFAALARMPVEGPEPVVWPYTPAYVGNPFQAVLYGDFEQQGLVAAPTFQATDLRRTLRDWPADLPLVVHLPRLLDDLKALGARLVWTVHNVLPHDTRFEEQEVALRRDVLERADLVHVMSPRTAELMSGWLTLPDAGSGRLYRCEHPGYHGVYPDWVSRAQARRRLRIPDGALALLLTGALKPYKGLTELLDALEEVSARRPGEVVLIAAGRPDDTPETAEFVARAAAHPAVRLLPGPVADADVQVLMRAADVVALPYRRCLNSGVLALALTFGRPVLLPATAGVADLVAGGAGLVYDPEPDGALAAAVESCLSWDLDAAGAAAVRAGAGIDRATIASRYAADLRTWVETGAGS